MNKFHEKYQDYSDSDLLEILEEASRYQDDAVIAAMDILTDRGIELSPEQKEIRIKKESKPEAPSLKSQDPTPGMDRLFAFFIDLIVLVICSFILGFILMSVSLATGYVPLTVSMLLITGYFAIGDSRLFNGATFGKRQMKLTVLSRDSTQINLKQSVVRTLLLFGPFFLFEYWDKLKIDSRILDILIPILRLNYFIALIYFFLLDKKLRRLYHDLILKTFVQKDNESVNYQSFPKKYIFYYSFILLSLLLIFITLNFRSVTQAGSIDNSTVEELQSTIDKNTTVFRQIVKEIEAVDNVAEINGLNIITTNNIRTDFIIDVQTKVSPKGSQGDIIANKVYNSLNGKTLYIEGLDNVQIILRYGFNMTLAKYNVEETKNFEQ